MSLPPESLDPIPDETARIAHLAFPHDSLAMCLRDVLGTLYHDGMFADLYAPLGHPATSPWRLALVTILQYAEHLTDRQAADAVRGRIDWKYALALPLDDAGFDATVLTDFRARLVAGSAEERLLWAVLEHEQVQRLIRKRGRQRTDSTHVLAAVRSLNRLELVGEMLRATLEALAVAAPDWLREQVPPAWAERYGRRIEEYRLPEGDAARQALAHEIGQDGVQLLAAVQADAAPTWVREIPLVQRLQQVWEQQYDLEPTLRWRATTALPPASELITSPYDGDARWGQKRQVRWAGYKAHWTETCAPGQPSLIVAVQTTSGSVPDQAMLEPIWDDERERDLLPGEHLVDTGYVDARALVRATALGISVVGPVQADSSWQARVDDGFDLTQFAIDWAAEQATCPQGKQSTTWRPTQTSRGIPTIQVHFRQADCQQCPVQAHCTTTTRRSLTLLPQAQHTARQAARTHQQSDTFRVLYRQRAGIEGTISQAVRRTGVRRTRYRGLAKVHLEHCADAAALNLIRLTAYLADVPRARTRQSHLVRLFAAA